MSTTTLVLPQELAEEIRAASMLSVETGGVLLAKLVESPGGETRLLGLRVRWVPDTSYQKRDVDQLVIDSGGYVPALGEAEEIGAVAIWIHTHPGLGAVPMPSRADVKVNRDLIEVFRIRSNQPWFASVIFSPTSSGLSFSGLLYQTDCSPRSIGRLWVVGDRLRLTSAYDAPSFGTASGFDRQVRAFGGDIQRVLHDLRVSVVGCGGTGSAVIEQLIRLGVRRLTLIDPDVVSESNLTRMYGSRPDDVGRPKVDVLKDLALSIDPGCGIEAHQGTLVNVHTALHLTGSDVIFGCTDDNAGRLVLSRAATYLLSPVIDCGVLLSADADGNLTDINGRITTLVPGQACLICRNRIDLQRAAAEQLTDKERAQRLAEGYAPSLPGVEPAVVTFTTAVASAAVTELLERLIGFGPDQRPSEILLRFHDREISTNQQTPNARHYCHPQAGKLGFGVSSPSSK